MSHLWAHYPLRQLANLQSLSAALRLPVGQLQEAARTADQSYRLASRTEKADGTYRETYDAHKNLKAIQHRINREIIRRVQFPCYLQGAVHDAVNPRDCIANAGLHVNAQTVVTEDATNFFPSITSAVVYDIWLSFFRFGPEVAECLTLLTTRRGVLVQGAKTSSGLANLAFWRAEPGLVAELESKGLTYSRFVDDVNVSSTTRLDNEEVTEIVKRIVDLFARHGCRVNRKKHRVAHKGRAVRVNNLAVAGNEPQLSKAERRRIRAGVRQFEFAAANPSVTKDELGAMRASLDGRLARMRRLRCGDVDRLAERVCVAVSQQVAT